MCAVITYSSNGFATIKSYLYFFGAQMHRLVILHGTSCRCYKQSSSSASFGFLLMHASIY
jgi:hypothetical protein